MPENIAVALGALMPHADEQFEVFLQAYPAGRRQRGYMTTQLFLTALGKVSFDVLIAALEQHKQSAQWKNPVMVPTMKTWLSEERWVQALPVDQQAAEAMRRDILTAPHVAGFECEGCRDRGWCDEVRNGKEVCIPCSCRATNSQYRRMTLASRKGGHEEVKR